MRSATTHSTLTVSGPKNGVLPDRRGPSAARGNNPDEIYANQFAAALLMPEEKVRELRGQIGPAAMAVEFGVSLEAMMFRLENLGLDRLVQMPQV